MSNIITIGYSTEGNTDKRFLEGIIKKTFEEVACLCNGIIEVYDPKHIQFPKNTNFVDAVKDLCKKASDTGIFVLCIHTDADAESDFSAFNNKINPAFNAIEQIEDASYCKNLVAIVPVRMTEAWILANKQILKEEINTNLSDNDLGINRIIENVADPKELIENAIRIAQENISKRRRKLTLNDIYQTMGQKLDISDLEKINSYAKFKESVIAAYKKLNYLN